MVERFFGAVVRSGWLFRATGPFSCGGAGRARKPHEPNTIMYGPGVSSTGDESPVQGGFSFIGSEAVLCKEMSLFADEL